MKKSNLLIFLLTGILIVMMSCKNNPIEKIQGVFSVDKTSLKALMTEKASNDSALATALLEKAIKNSVLEFKINGDSISGLIFLAGQTTIINSKIQVRNDSLIIKSNNSDSYLIPNEKGILFKNKKSDMNIQVLKSNNKDLSVETKEALKNIQQEERELKMFTDNLGKWQKGSFVDEFGDKTGKGFPYILVVGKHENSSIVNSEVYVKTIIDGEGLYFQILNKNMSIKKTFPDRKFGTIKIKFPDGIVKNEKVFFYKNTVSESPDDKNNQIYNHLIKKNGELKILIDLSTASKYYSDKYHFKISKSNLDEILTDLK